MTSASCCIMLHHFCDFCDFCDFSLLASANAAITLPHPVIGVLPRTVR